MGLLVWPIPYVGAITPSFGLVAIYYWAMYRPDLMKPSLVFLLGLVADAMAFLPLGLSALVYVGAYQLSFSQRRFFVGQFFRYLIQLCVASRFKPFPMAVFIFDGLCHVRQTRFSKRF